MIWILEFDDVTHHSCNFLTKLLIFRLIDAYKIRNKATGIKLEKSYRLLSNAEAARETPFSVLRVLCILLLSVFKLKKKERNSTSLQVFLMQH